MFQAKVAGKIKKELCSVYFFFSKSVLWDNVENYFGATDDDIIMGRTDEFPIPDN